MAIYTNDVRKVFGWAVVPAALCMITILVFVREPQGVPRDGQARSWWPIHRVELKQLGRAFWILQMIAGALGLARFSEAFLLLRVQNAGVPIGLVPSTLIVMNVVYAVAAYPVGWMSDRISRSMLLLISAAILAVAQLTLAFPGRLTALIGVVLWGLHLGISQGVLSAMVADASPADRRGTAFGIFNLVTGVATLLASGVAGALWTFEGPSASFVAGTAMSSFTCVLLLFSGRLESTDSAQMIDR